MKTSHLFALAFVAAGLVIAGCNKGHVSVKRVTVSGKITYEGKALKTGTITFDPGTGEVPASLEILDGLYEGKAPVGKNTVRISAMQKISMKEKMKMDGPGYDQMTDEEMLPPRYNRESKITKEIEEGENKFNFDLTKD